MKTENENLTNLNSLENFLTNFHEKEVREGQIREVLYDIIHTIDENTANTNSSIVYKIVLSK